MHLSRILRILPLSIALACAACGGGGGSSPSTSSPSAPSSPNGSTVYTGNDKPADITVRNAAHLTAIALDVAGDSGSVNGAVGAVKSTGASAAAAETARPVRARLLGLAAAVRAAPAADAPRTKANGERSVPCDGGGTVIVSGQLARGVDDVVTAEFRGCTIEGTQATGSMTLQVAAWSDTTGDPADFTVTFSSLRLASASQQATASGTVRDTIDTQAFTETIVENLVIVDETRGRSVWRRDVKTVIQYPALPSAGYTLRTTTGRIYDAVHGYVDLSTAAAELLPYPLPTTTTFSDTGQWRLSGAGGRSIWPEAKSASHLRLTIDPPAGATKSTVATLRWDALEGAGADDLADSDGDGMHDGWERFYGLAVADASDASADPDGDGVANLGEYALGTSPRDAASRPARADLQLTVSSAYGAGTSGLWYKVALIIQNRGPDAVTGGRVELELPDGVTFVEGTATVMYGLTDKVSNSVQQPCVRLPKPVCAFGMLLGAGWADTTYVFVTLLAADASPRSAAFVASGTVYDPTPADARQTVDLRFGP